ncbi:hypothetical protein GGQ97_001096 [Sphingomonas kaistensis]|uniref:Phosphatidate cytidylyltransferase n=1 Tax=Sphingomonas kaistensis TaxID=298708 RepID=A0A7X6BFX1_9SPHN|nr:hypothetical protein [Sphingomonas kaistensis]NJC05303.1 hypothetical protein [Sphingomonas kaistensis]
MAALRGLVAEELGHAVDPRIAAMAAAIAAAHGTASRAVLFYGSCLRDVALEGAMLDFYLIVSDYAEAYPARWMAAANRLIPPNVFPFAQGDLIAKYAVLSEADFHRLNGPETRSVSVWARFAQPSRLVWVADEAAREKVVAAVSRAAPTLLSAALSAVPNDQPPLDLWKAAFALTYSAELRAEKKERGVNVVDQDPQRYLRFFGPAMAAARACGKRCSGSWKRRRVEGKLLSVARLAKASATFAGGAEYIAWKINRHAGTKIELSDWQKKHPLVTAVTLLPRLIRSGAIR